ncbi:ribokinase [Acholeplasma laidlawii]|uniref:Ribokinase n=1 Tax=Acholeplasma laidlawii (strain PG-8A) TaxID=441768 RepID=A9NE05_ACHLI|nr:ribokinase [Acholeplasma laidlawii]ABX81965.1 ribokinase [Acholeplasma laidlawii PG-8A]RED19219.1 ribokinase [Acholeplasma laidlawii]SQH57560.1 Ribokinase [Acholeplasma laidlawii]
MNQKNKVYVLGSINVDMSISVDKIPLEGETKSGHEFIKNIGDKGANQAVSAAKLGAKTYLIAAVGKDIFGKEALISIEKNGVDTRYVSLADSHTGMAFITRTNRDNRIILHEGANHKIEQDKVLEAVQGNPGDILVSQYEIPYEIVKSAFKKAKSLNMITILNPAPSRYLEEDIYPYVDYIILNQTECEILSGVYPTHEQDVKKAASYLFKKGITRLIVTMGSKGSVYMSKDELYESKAYKIKTVDTTGAGDAYIGAFAYGLAMHEPITTCLKIASAAGAYACLKEGVEDAMGTYSDIEKLMEESK